jgi:hypothetical protein
MRRIQNKTINKDNRATENLLSILTRQSASARHLALFVARVTRRIFAQLMLFFGLFFFNCGSSPKFWTILFLSKYCVCIIFDRMVELHFGRFFTKSSWRPVCSKDTITCVKTIMYLREDPLTQL